jgi:hypothetical protein
MASASPFVELKKRKKERKKEERKRGPDANIYKRTKREKELNVGREGKGGGGGGKRGEKQKERKSSLCDGHGRRSVSLRVDRDNRSSVGGNRSRLLDIGWTG